MTAPARPRVLMLLENGPCSRDARVPKEAETLVSAGYQVTVICPGEQDLPRRDQQSGVRIYRFPPPPEGEGLLDATGLGAVGAAQDDQVPYPQQAFDTWWYNFWGNHRWN